MHLYDDLKKILARMGSVLAAFSGGADSALLLAAAAEALGKENVLAVTADSPIRFPEEKGRAREIAAGLGVEHLLISSDELQDQQVAFNSSQRCYHCKRRLFSRLLGIAEERGMAFVAEGSNLDDAGLYRPGRKAVKELGIRSPLEEARLTKKDVRDISKKIGLPTWNAPSRSCLLTRFPYGSKIGLEALEKVRRAESFIAGLGFSQVRARVDSDRVRLEVSPDEVPLLRKADIFSKIEGELRRLGYGDIEIAPEGYREDVFDGGKAWTEKG